MEVNRGSCGRIFMRPFEGMNTYGKRIWLWVQGYLQRVLPVEIVVP